MNNKQQQIDTVVIGGGLAGLAAASYLAKAGQEVVLLEKASSLGGRAISQEHSGFLFNLGAHALYDGNPGVKVLRELGVSFTYGSPVGVKCMSHGKTSAYPADIPSLLRTDLLSPAAKWEAARLLLKLVLSDAQNLARTTVNEWLDREVKHPEVRRFMRTNACVTTYSSSPDHLSMGLVAEQLQLLAKGKIMYIDGGWQTLVDGLEKTAREAGAQIVTGARVEAVEHKSGSVSAVRLADGTVYHPRAVVIAAAPDDALKLVEGDESLVLKDWAESTVLVHAACLDVALRRLPEPNNRVVMSLDRPLFLTAQSEFSKVAPAGGVLLYALKYLDPFAPHDADADRRELEEWLDSTQPGWQAEVIERRYLPHLVVTNGLVEAAKGGAAGRPGPEVPGVRGLYVAGDWVGPDGQLGAASLWSGKLAAQSILVGAGSETLRKAA